MNKTASIEMSNLESLFKGDLGEKNIESYSTLFELLTGKIRIRLVACQVQILCVTNGRCNFKIQD